MAAPIPPLLLPLPLTMLPRIPLPNALPRIATAAPIKVLVVELPLLYCGLLLYPLPL